MREEDSEGAHVYRPASDPLPPARGRNGIELRSDGTYVTMRPGPVDAPVASEARAWSSANPGQLRLHDDTGRVVTAFEIVDVSDDVLRLRPLDPEAPCQAP